MTNSPTAIDRIVASPWSTSDLQVWALNWLAYDYDTTGRLVRDIISADADSAAIYYAGLIAEDEADARQQAAEALVWGGWTLDRINFRKS